MFQIAKKKVCHMNAGRARGVRLRNVGRVRRRRFAEETESVFPPRQANPPLVG